MSQQQPVALSDLLDLIERRVATHVDIASEGAARTQQFKAQPPALTGSIDQSFNVPVVGGHGDQSTPEKTTAWVTISGTVTVTAPPNGSWSLVARDLVAGKTVFSHSGVGPNQPIPFNYKTGFHTQLAFTADWTEQATTTLVLHIKATY